MGEEALFEVEPHVGNVQRAGAAETQSDRRFVPTTSASVACPTTRCRGAGSFAPKSTIATPFLPPGPTKGPVVTKACPKNIGHRWALLEKHFQRHALAVRRFASADPAAVAHMWETGTNDAGKRLSQFEREALIERYCEVFGCWPVTHLKRKCCQTAPNT
jgi:hypothetical protein